MILDLPTLPGFVTLSFKPESVVASSESGFSKKVQVYDWGGKRWGITASLPVMSEANGKEWEAFLLDLNGKAGTFYLFDPLVMRPRGVASGAVEFVESSGRSITLDGFAPSVVGQLEKGDWLQIGDRLYRALTRATSDATGRASLNVWPSVPSTVAAGASVEVREPKGEFRLAELPETNWRVDGLLDAFEIQAMSEV